MLADGSSTTYRFAPDASVEVLESAALEEIAIGDWLNGGAVPHAETLLVLLDLILIPDPVVSP